MALETFGSKIADKRKELEMSQKELASKIKKEDGSPISPQYLNDIEHDRRDPPSDVIIKNLARTLDFSEDYLFALSKRISENLHKEIASVPPEKVSQAFQAFRKKIKD